MNEDFEKELANLKNNEEKIPGEVKEKIDVAYQKIKTSRNKKRRLGTILIASIAALVLIVVCISPITQAVGNYLKFGQFTSKKLVEEEFVHQLNSVVKDNEIEIKLEKAYIDQKQLGLYFIINLPEKSELMSSKIDYYNLGFSIKEDGEVLFTNNSTENSQVDSYTFNEYFDDSTNTLEISYLINSFENNFDTMEELSVEINKISGINQGEKGAGKGFSKVEILTTEGNWPLLLNVQEMKNFQPIGFTGNVIETGNKAFGKAYPTMFVVEADPLNGAKNSTDIKLTYESEGKLKESNLLASRLSSEGKVLWYFDFIGYDEQDVLNVQIDGKDVIVLKK